MRAASPVRRTLRMQQVSPKGKRAPTANPVSCRCTATSNAASLRFVALLDISNDMRRCSLGEIAGRTRRMSAMTSLYKVSCLLCRNDQPRVESPKHAVGFLHHGGGLGVLSFEEEVLRGLSAEFRSLWSVWTLQNQDEVSSPLDRLNARHRLKPTGQRPVVRDGVKYLPFSFGVASELLNLMCVKHQKQDFSRSHFFWVAKNIRYPLSRAACSCSALNPDGDAKALSEASSIADTTSFLSSSISITHRP